MHRRGGPGPTSTHSYRMPASDRGSRSVTTVVCLESMERLISFEPTTLCGKERAAAKGQCWRGILAAAAVVHTRWILLLGRAPVRLSRFL